MPRLQTVFHSHFSSFTASNRPVPAWSRVHRMHLSRLLVSPAEVDGALKTRESQARRLIPVSAAWFLPNDPDKRTGSQSFRQRHIAGSRFFDLEEIKDASSPWPHMLPDSKTFADAMGRLGIRRDDTVIVYDTAELGIFSAPRVAWTLKVFGHPRVHLLNNFRAWVEEGRSTESGEQEDVETETYDMPQPWSVDKSITDFNEMEAIARHSLENTQQARGSTVLDARPKGRWEGTAPEPRPGMPSGHMPGSISLPFTDVLDPESKTILPAEKLRELLKARQVPPDQDIISSCGTGVTAAVVDVALAEAEWPFSGTRRIYDGSWTEWGSRVRPGEGLIQVST